LLAFALMPNHFHLLVKQRTTDGIIKFMRRLNTSYAMYFNKKYNRVGSLFQGNYKGIIVTTDEYLVHASRYIHRNPYKLSSTDINFNEYTSLSYYSGIKNTSWVKPLEVLQYF